MENIPSEPMTNINQSMNEINEIREKSLIESKKENDIRKLNLIQKRKEKRQKKVEKIIQKWLALQKTIKEEITLEEVILKQQDDDFDNLKDLFTQYYETKIKSRQQFEIIKNLEKNIKTENKEYKIEKDIDRVLLDASDPIRNLMFILRNNYDYITKLVSLIDETDEPEKIDSLVELFCNQFYENILIPNPEQEELLILIYKLLEEEITPMNSASIDEFLNDTSFIGKFISSFMNKRELKVFLTMLLNPLILSIENSEIECMDLSLNNIIKDINKNKLNDIDQIKDYSEITLESLMDRIPKTTIHFKNYYVLENEQEEEENADRSGINLEEKDVNNNRDSITSGSSYNSRYNSIDINIDIKKCNQEYRQKLDLDN